MFVEIHLHEFDEGTLEVVQGESSDEAQIQFRSNDYRIVLPGAGRAGARCARKLALKLMSLAAEMTQDVENEVRAAEQTIIPELDTVVSMGD